MQDTTQTISLKDTFTWLTERPSKDHTAYNCPPEHLVELMHALVNAHGYEMLSELSGVDWGVSASPRFSCFYHLYSLERHEYLRIVVDCASVTEPTLPSVTSIWGGANWLEREVYDMYGVTFSGHPDLRRILMWDNYPFNPLRKDFPLAGIPAPLPNEDTTVAAEIQGGMTIAAPEAGGPFTAGCGTVSSKIEPRSKDQAWSEKCPKH